MRTKPVVGQTLYSLNIGNAARGRAQTLKPVIVTKVGSKYFTCGEGWQSKQYHIDGWCEKTDYSPDSALYESEKEWEDERLASELYRGIKNLFSFGSTTRLSLDQLVKIKKIIDGEENDRKTTK